MTDEVRKRVVLIDLSSLFWTAYMVNAENKPQAALSITLENVKRCIGESSPLVAICCDSGRSFRKDLSADYKATRDKQPEAAYGLLQRTKERLRADGYLLWEAPNFEADDVIATACDRAVREGHEVRVCSADKDMFQLIGPTVDVLRTNTWEVWTAATVKEKLGITPMQMVDFLALQGDSSDNVPGCAGIGKVRAAELLAKYGTLHALYKALDNKETVATPANQKALTEQRAAVELSRQLVQMSYEAPIEFEQIYQERKAKTLSENKGLDRDEPEDDEGPKGERAPTAMAPEVFVSSELEPSAAGSSPATVALVPVEYERQLEPTSMERAFKLACTLFDSRLYTKFPNEQAIMAVILRGRELGLGASTALDVFHVIDGRPVPYAYFIIARAKADRACEWFQNVEADEKHALWITKNRNNPTETRVLYTIDQARGAKLIKPGGAWEKGPEDMLVKTAGAKLSRREYPGAALGLVSYEEMGGES